MVWLALIFLALYVLLAKWALPQVSEVLAARAAIIARDLDAAREAKAEADAAVAELTAATRQAQARRPGRDRRAVAAARKEAADRRRPPSAAQAQLARSRGTDRRARASALGALRQVATDTAVAVVTRLTGHDARGPGRRAAVGTALAARGQAQEKAMQDGSFLQNPRLWVAVAFVIFFVIFGRKLWKAVAEMLDKRADTVRAELAAAPRLRQEAEAMLRDAKARREAALADAKALLEGAKSRPNASPPPPPPRPKPPRSAANAWPWTASPPPKRPRWTKFA